MLTSFLACSVPVKLEMRAYFLAYLDECVWCLTAGWSCGHADRLHAGEPQGWRGLSPRSWCSSCAAPPSCAGLTRTAFAASSRMHNSCSTRAPRCSNSLHMHMRL